MAPELECTEISEAPDLASLVDEARASGRPPALTRNGEAVAEIRPVARHRSRRGPAGKRRSEADAGAFLSSAGGWKGSTDGEALKAAVRKRRTVEAQPDQRRGVRIPTEAELAISHSAAGGWQDVDVDRLIAEIYADRDLADCPPVEL